MSPALRALVDADNRRPGPSDADRTRVYAALGVSLGVLPVGAVVAAHAATTSAATASSTASTVGGAASVVGRVALLAKLPLAGVGLGVVLGATLTAYVVKGPAARWTASARARHAAATATAPARNGVAAPAVASETAVAPAVAPETAAAPIVAAPALAPAALPSKAAAAPAPGEAPRPAALRPAFAPAPHHAVAAASSAREKVERTSEPSIDEPRDEARPVAPPTMSGVLAAEQALLDPARAALAQGDGAGALARLAQHERRFPNGALAQEREAMTIRALVLAGDRDAARARAESFRSRYPGSLLTPMIEKTLAAPVDAPAGSRR
jgi:hypothetical protein